MSANGDRQGFDAFEFGIGGSYAFVLRHLFPRMSSWSGVANRRLADQMLQAGSTGVVIGARFPSGMQMRPQVDWYRMELAIDGKPVQEFWYFDGFKLFRENRPRFIRVDPGTYEAQLWSNAELPIPKARFRLAPEQVLLIEAHPGCSKRIRGLQAKLEVLSGRSEVVASSRESGRKGDRRD